MNEIDPLDEELKTCDVQDHVQSPPGAVPAAGLRPTATPLFPAPPPGIGLISHTRVRSFVLQPEVPDDSMVSASETFAPGSGGLVAFLHPRTSAKRGVLSGGSRL